MYTVEITFKPTDIEFELELQEFDRPAEATAYLHKFSENNKMLERAYRDVLFFTIRKTFRKEQVHLNWEEISNMNYGILKRVQNI